MAENGSRVGRGGGRVGGNKRYILWLYVMNLLLGGFGTVAFFVQSGTMLGESMYSNRLVHGFDLPVLLEMFARPEFGPTAPSALSAVFFAAVFFLLTALFLPGVFEGYAANYRLPGEGFSRSGALQGYAGQHRLPGDEFFRACGRNLWRFVRLLLVCGIGFLIMGGALVGIQGRLVEKAEER